jgi:hypothetical protein
MSAQTGYASNAIPVDMFRNKDLGVQYRLWQSNQPNHGEIGMIHSAAEFAQFCKDDNIRDSDSHLDRNNRRIGSRCGHLLHPVVEERFEYCPVCDIVIHLDLLQHIAEAWDAEGGPGVEGLMTDQYDVIQSAWHKTRLELERLVGDVQEDADDEARWENDNPEEAEVARKTLSSTKAITVARTMSRYPIAVITGHLPEATVLNRTRRPVGSMLTAALTGHATPPPTPQKQKEKRVTFTSDTIFAPARQSHEFQRKSQFYEPAENDADSPGNFIDTSNPSNRFFNARQLKVVTDFEGEGLNDLVSNIATPHHEGIAVKHPRWPEIRQILFDMYEEQDRMIKLNFLRELKTADYLLVNVDENDKVTDVVPYTTQEIEDLVGEEAEECKVSVQKMKWTSHLDVLPNGYLDAIQCAYVEVGEQVANDDEGYEADEEDGEEEGGEEEEDTMETNSDSEQRPVDVTKKRKAEETFEDSVSKRAK